VIEMTPTNALLNAGSRLGLLVGTRLLEGF
jgi:hypothetical protein